MLARVLRARNHPRVALDARQLRQHPRRRRRQRHQPRAGLRVRELQLARGKVHMLPLKLDDLVAPASRQHQQTDRRRRIDRQPALGLHPVQHRAEVTELRLGQEPLALLLPVLAHVLARVAAGPQLPFLGEVEQLAADLQRPVRLIGDVAEIEVERVDVLALDVLHRHAAVGRHDEALHHAAVHPLRALLAAHVDMLFQIARGKLGHRHRAPLHRLLAALDAVDRKSCFLARLVGGDYPVAPQRHPARLPLVPGLDHVDLRAARIDPHPESGNPVVPEHRVAVLHRERIDGALGDGAVFELGHAMPLVENNSRRLRSRDAFLHAVSVSASQATGGNLMALISSPKPGFKGVSASGKPLLHSRKYQKLSLQASRGISRPLPSQSPKIAPHLSAADIDADPDLRLRCRHLRPCPRRRPRSGTGRPTPAHLAQPGPARRAP